MSIHLVQSGIANLLTMFPDCGFEQAEIDRYNRITQFEWERMRDFLVLHYNATGRDDSAFWNDCLIMSVPDGLADKIALFKSRGHCAAAPAGLSAVCC